MDNFINNLKKEDLEKLYKIYNEISLLEKELEKNIKDLPPKEEI